MKRTSPRGQGFTLVELLAALAVLSLLVLIMGQVMSLTGQAIAINSKSLDAASQARLVFDRIGMDWAARPNRTDLAMIFTKGTLNDCFRFYSQVSGYAGDRGITAVGYVIPDTANGQKPASELERGATGSYWMTTSGQNLFFLPSTLSEADNFSATATDNPAADYEVLANGVFRLEFCYLLNSGLLSDSNGSTLTGAAAATDFSNVAAVVIALGVVDSKSLALLPTPSTALSALANALPKAAGQDPVAKWTPLVSVGLSVANVPKPVLDNVRVYERTFYVR